MFDSLKLILDKFETFIKRALLPSTSFVFMFIIFDIYCQNHILIDALDEKHSKLVIIIIFMSFIGLSTTLSIIHQYIYDNGIKANYNPKYLFKSEEKELNKLREAVIKKLKITNDEIKEDELTDYQLYQQLGGKYLDNKRYVDDVKSIGIFFVSLMIVLGFTIYKLYIANHIVIATILLMSTIFFYKLGEELILSKYRSRAIRIYNNFLNADTKNKNFTQTFLI